MQQMSQSANLRTWYIFMWIIDGCWHGTVIYYICQFVFVGGLTYSNAEFSQPGGGNAQVDYNMFGNACYIYLVVTASMRIVLMSHNLNLIFILGLFITGAANLGVMFIYQVFLRSK